MTPSITFIENLEICSVLRAIRPSFKVAENESDSPALNSLVVAIVRSYERAGHEVNNLRGENMTLP